MGAIRVMQTRRNNIDIVDPDVQRREGTRTLGSRIIGIFATTPDEHRDELAAVLQSLIDGDPANTYEVFYDEGTGSSIRLTGAQASGPNVMCSHESGGNPVTLLVRLDADDGASRTMDVIFPHPDVRNDYAYLVEAATDLMDMPVADNPVTKGQQYLAAFKLLSRCK